MRCLLLLKSEQLDWLTQPVKVNVKGHARKDGSYVKPHQATRKKAPKKGSASKTIDVPSRGRKWVTGALVRDRVTQELYRVTGKPVRYHEDCLPIQRVSKARNVPPDWQATMRALEIMKRVRDDGIHTPSSRGAYGRPSGQVGEQPAASGEVVRWEARPNAWSTPYAVYPSIEVRGDVLRYVEPIYDDAPVVTWLVDPALADEARALIASGPSLSRYPEVSVRE